MIRKILAILLTSVMLTVMCFSILACEEKLPTPEEVIEGLVDTHLDVKSYEMEGKAVLKMELDIPEEEKSLGIPMDVDVEIDIKSSFDAAGEEMMMSMDIGMDMVGEATIKMAMEMYLVDAWMYMMVDAPMTSPQWTKTEMSYGEFLEEMESIDFTETQMEFLKSGEITITGVEKIDGIDCYVLEIIPDMGKLWEILMQQSQLTGGGIMDMPMDDFDEMMGSVEDIIKDISAKYWIAKDTYYIAKGDMTFKIEITPESMGMTDEEGSVAMDVTMNMRMFNYNKPISITLPPEAENAVEETMW